MTIIEFDFCSIKDWGIGYDSLSISDEGRSLAVVADQL